MNQSTSTVLSLADEYHALLKSDKSMDKFMLEQVRNALAVIVVRHPGLTDKEKMGAMIVGALIYNEILKDADRIVGEALAQFNAQQDAWGLVKH